MRLLLCSCMTGQGSYLKMGSVAVTVEEMLCKMILAFEGLMNMHAVSADMFDIAMSC